MLRIVRSKGSFVGRVAAAKAQIEIKDNTKREAGRHAETVHYLLNKGSRQKKREKKKKKKRLVNISSMGVVLRRGRDAV